MSVTARRAGGGSSAHRVLIIEDDATSAGALRAILVRRGCEVFSANTMALAQEMLALRPDVIVLDLMLPDGEGDWLLKRIRREGLPTRIAVTTAVSDLDRLASLRQLGADAVLRKPVNLNELLRALGLDT